MRAQEARHTALSILRIPHHRTSVYNNSFTANACCVCNSLSKSIRSLESQVGFGFWSSYQEPSFGVDDCICLSWGLIVLTHTVWMMNINCIQYHIVIDMLILLVLYFIICALSKLHIGINIYLYIFCMVSDLLKFKGQTINW